MDMPATHPLPHFDALNAHEDRLVRLEDALLESAKQTAELSGCMRNFGSQLETMMDTLQGNLQAASIRAAETEKALSEIAKRTEALEARKQQEAKARAAWIDVAQKIGVYAATTSVGAVGGWLLKVMFGS